jgi:hypothetical protein
MSIKIAFTSCCDAVRAPEPITWATLAAQGPSHIVLLGDNIYMDYGLGDHIGNGKALHLPLAEFSQRMHGYYAQQWAVQHFRQTLAGRQVHAVWDDHALGCNNGRCLEPHTDEFTDSRYMPPAYRQCARVLFEQFRNTLKTQPLQYPANPVPNGVAAQDLGSIAQTVNLAPGLRLHLTDGRSPTTSLASRAAARARYQLGGQRHHAERLEDVLPRLCVAAQTGEAPSHLGVERRHPRARFPRARAALRSHRQPHGPASGHHRCGGQKVGGVALLTLDTAQLTLQWWVEGQLQATLTQHISRADWQVA